MAAFQMSLRYSANRTLVAGDSKSRVVQGLFQIASRKKQCTWQDLRQADMQWASLTKLQLPDCQSCIPTALVNDIESQSDCS